MGAVRRQAMDVPGVPRVEEVTPQGWLLTTPVGTPLREFLGKLPEGDRRGAILRVIRQVHDTLCAAHKADIVHGDVRPSNIVIVPSEDGSFSVVLVDWEHAFTVEGMRAERAGWASDDGEWPALREVVQECLPPAVVAAINGLAASK